MTDSRVPRWSEMIDTKPYASSGSTAAMPRSIANRVAMCRAFMPLASARRQLSASRFPHADCAQHVAPFFCLHLESLADGARADRPGEEHARRVVHERLLQITDGFAVLVVRFGVADVIERSVGLRRTEVCKVQWP